MRKIHCLIYSVLMLFIIQDASAGKRKVLLIGIDGVRSDILSNLHTPAINFLSDHGFGTFGSWHQDITISAPSWSSILCGVYHDKHGITDNTFSGKNYEKYPMLPVLAKQLQPDLKFGMYMEWKKFYKNSENNGWDQTILGELGNTGKTNSEASDWIVNSDLDFYFVYLSAPDFWGHLLGFSSYNPFYVNAIRDTDHSITVLMNALKNRMNYQNEDWLILLTTDHGGNGIDHGGYSTSERNIFWFAYSDRIVPKLVKGMDTGNKNIVCNKVCPMKKRNTPVQTDIAVTALHHLLYETGCNPEECNHWQLEGKSWLKEMGLYSDKKYLQNLASIKP